MSTVEAIDSAQTRVSKQAVAKQFVRLYYSILNTHNGFLYQFYGKNSSVTVRETLDGKEALTESAEHEAAVKELLQSLYVDVSVKVDSAVPQFSVDDTVLLHINGTMHRKSMGTCRAFTQAFVLYPQENGYYIRTDVVHVLGYSQDRPLLGYWGQDTWGKAQGGSSQNDAAASVTSGEDVPLQLGSYQGTIPDDGATTSKDIRTATPPLEDTPRRYLPNKSHESDHESDEVAAKKQPQPWIMRPQGSKTSSVTHTAVMPPPVMMAPPMPVPPLHVPTASMAFPMPMGPPTAARYMRQRSMSMGCDPWSVQTQMGHGVFIARLPFGIQPADVEEAFSVFGPILGGRDGIQVRDGRNGCYAFVTFENAESARTAIQQGAVLQGKRVFIEPRYPRQETEAPIVAYPTMMTAPIPTYPIHAPRHVPRMP